MIDINSKVQNLLSSKQYYYSLKNKKIKKNYWTARKDPDGKLRDRILNHNVERKKFILNNSSLIKNIKKLNFKSLCDLGCGSGYLLSAIKSKKNTLTGVDNDDIAIKMASKYGTILKRNLNSKNFLIKKKFDVIVTYHAIEHLKKPENLIKNIRKILKKNGILIIGTPDFDSAMARYYKNKFRLLHDPTHVSLFSTDSLLRFLRDQKFEILKVDYPYFETSYFNKKNILRLFSKKNYLYSPPFYGSFVNIYCKKQ